MTGSSKTPILDGVSSPKDLRVLPREVLPQLAEELRRELIDIVSVTGGHLGSSLGVVELTLALHYVFNTPEDRLIWDVGHQAYIHKLLTGRRERMRTLRQAGGLSGFTKRSESEYDPFGAAHSSTSISAGCGFGGPERASFALGVVTVLSWCPQSRQTSRLEASPSARNCSATGRGVRARPGDRRHVV